MWFFVRPLKCIAHCVLMVLETDGFLYWQLLMLNYTKALINAPKILKQTEKKKTEIKCTFMI